MWKRFAHSIQTKIICLFAAVLLVQVVFSVLFFRYVFVRQIEDSAYENLDLFFEQTQETLSGAFSMVENTMIYFFSDDTLRARMLEAEGSLDAVGDLTANIALDNALKHSIMSNSAWQNELLGSAWFFVGEHAYSFYSRSRHSLTVLNEQYRKVFKQMQNVPAGEMVIFPPVDQQPIFFVAQNYSLSNDSPLTCSLIFSIDESVLRDKFAGVLAYEGAQAYLVDSKGTILSSGDPSLLGQQAPPRIVEGVAGAGENPREISVDGKLYYSSVDKVSTMGLYFIADVPRESLMAGGEQMIQRYILIMVAVSVLLLAGGVFAIYRGTGFLKAISNCLSEIRSGNYETRMPMYKSTELFELSETFNGMADSIGHLINEVYEKQLAVKQANIRYLQSQINPHFLFNAFSAIGVKAKLAHEESIYKMVTSLSTLLSATFRFDDESPVSVSEEMDYINCYLYIQKERFGARLSYQVEMEDEDLAEAMIPRLCVEPIVENAVVHGMECRRDGGYVRVTVRRSENNLLFVVTNNGDGFPDGVKKVEDLPPKRDGRKLVGLRNTHQRIKLLYGNDYGVFLGQSKEGETCVTVCLPLNTKEVEPNV